MSATIPPPPPLPPTPGGKKPSKRPSPVPAKAIAFGAVKVEALSTHLMSVSQASARTAVATFTDRDFAKQRLAAIEAGSALEYLARSVLAHHDAGLLAKGDSYPSRLALSNVSMPESFDLTTLRTVSYEELVKMLTGISQRISNLKTTMDYTMAVRNAAIHMALTDDASRREAVLGLVRSVAELLPLAAVSPEDYWGAGHQALADALLADHENQVSAQVESLLLSARERYEERAVHLSDDALRQLIAILEAQPVPNESDEDVEVETCECPACGSDGTLLLARELEFSQGEISWEYNEQWDDEPLAVIPVNGVPFRFHCNVCSLLLEDEQLGLHDDMDEIRDLDTEKMSASTYWADHGYDPY